MTDALTCSSNMPAGEKCISLAFENIVLKVKAEQNEMRQLRFYPGWSLLETLRGNYSIYNNAGNMHSDKQSALKFKSW